jgi:hypothetical protein
VKAATLRTAINMSLAAVPSMRPPGFMTKIHIVTQNPPRRHPRPSIISEMSKEAAPKMIPKRTIATNYAPWTAFETGGVMTNIISTVTARLVRYPEEKKTFSLLALIPINR